MKCFLLLCTATECLCALQHGATPFSLVYGTDAVLPVEVEIPSLRVLMETRIDEAEWVQTRFNQLNLIDEK